MRTQDSTPHPAEQPIDSFTHCHAGILKKLQSLAELQALLAPALRARDIAEQSIEFFREVIFEHHLDEERELFPAVLNHAQTGQERTDVQAMITRLSNEHRELEQTWKRLESELKHVLKGHSKATQLPDIDKLVSAYQAHAIFEETEFLPRARDILERHSSQLAALGLSLHVRHASALSGGLI